MAEVGFFQKQGEGVPVGVRWPGTQGLHAAVKSPSVRMAGNESGRGFGKRCVGEFFRKCHPGVRSRRPEARREGRVQDGGQILPDTCPVHPFCFYPAPRKKLFEQSAGLKKARHAFFMGSPQKL